MEIRTVDLSNNPKEIEVSSCISAGHHGIHNHNGECSSVCEVVFLGNRLGHGTNFDGALFDPNGISPTVLARDYKGAKEIIEIRKVDIVNERNKIAKSRAEQLDGCVRIGNVYGEQFGGGYAGNVWDSNGVAPTVMTMQGGGRQPHIVEVNNLNDKTIKIKVRHANKKGFEEVAIPGVADLCYPSSTTRRGRVNEGGADKSYTLCGESP